MNIKIMKKITLLSLRRLIAEQLKNIYSFFKWNGERKSYYANGQLKAIANWKGNKLNGEAKSYYENGQLQGIANYKNGKANGKWTFYYESGKLEIISNLERWQKEW